MSVPASSLLVYLCYVYFFLRRRVLHTVLSSWQRRSTSTAEHRATTSLIRCYGVSDVHELVRRPSGLRQHSRSDVTVHSGWTSCTDRRMDLVGQWASGDNGAWTSGTAEQRITAVPRVC